ncbi:nitrate reductase [Epibacterium ulvae]|uniref:nitrate reductase n=1 Tax=Epibacterium ulvae TaxID=1156985 RepID=UPI00249253E8|nr:nitrate reductase [Epibacterium ulvae]
MSTCTTCPYCGVGCGVLAGADGSIKGDPNHPANAGRLCSKGTALGATIGLEGRLLAPSLKGADVSWDHALDLVAQKFSEAIRDHGPESVAFYLSGQLLTEDYYVANKLIKGFMGSANIDTNSRLCMASAVAGHKRAFGTDTVPGQYEDFELADTIVLVGSNTAWCHPVLFRRIEAAKAACPDLKIVVIDPRRTATCQIADLHLPIQSDGDAALFNHLLCEIKARGLINHDYVSAHVNGLEAALGAAAQSNASSETCGLNPDQINAFVDLWCKSEKVVTLFSMGVNQSAYGTDKVNAILNCHLATGRIGRPGMGPFSMTGQPNAMGGREVGGLSNMLASHLDLENADHRAAVQEFWAAPAMPEKPGLKAVDLFRACRDGKIKALWVMSTNPVVSMPEADFVAEAIRSVPFTVGSDIIARTDTMDCVDLRLPAAGWGEKSGTVTNSERCISRQRPFLPMPGEARADWAVLAAVGCRMGWKEAFDYASPAEVFREHASLSGVSGALGRDFDISGLETLSDVDYDHLTPQVWPIPAGYEVENKRFFAEGKFYHPDGKAKMLPITPPELAQPEGETLRFNTARVRDHWHTMTRTGRAPQLGAHMGEPYLEVHPEDALRLGLQAAGLVEIENSHGRAVLRVLITDRVQKGACCAPMHWTAQTAAAGRVNALVTGRVDAVSGQPALKMAKVKARAYPAAWFGFAVSVAEMQPNRPYAALARSKQGWRVEVAGHKLPRDWDKETRSVLGVQNGTISRFDDSASGMVRIAIHDGAQLLGAFFAAREPVQVARAAIADLIGKDIPAARVLAGVPGQDQPAKGAIVCACMDVGRLDLQRAIAAGADSVPALMECTGAGTNCGSCKPELADLIAQLDTQRMAAE